MTKKGSAYNASRYALLSLRPPRCCKGCGWSPSQKLTEFEGVHHITRKNTRTLLERNILIAYRYKYTWYAGVCTCDWNKPKLGYFRDYCKYKRKNHPAKKGKNRLCTGYAEMDKLNAYLYPQW